MGKKIISLITISLLFLMGITFIYINEYYKSHLVSKCSINSEYTPYIFSFNRGELQCFASLPAVFYNSQTNECEVIRGCFYEKPFPKGSSNITEQMNECEALCKN